MHFHAPLVRATLLQRYKRFLADVRFDDGTITTVHVANPGTMMGLIAPGEEIWVSPASNPDRKLQWNWELVTDNGHLVGINTAHPNAIVAEALKADAIPGLRGYEMHRREVKYGKNSRIDVLLESPGKPACYLEVKNVHMKRGPDACFPDCVTARGAKHLEELSDMVRAGYRAVMLFLVQRDDCKDFTFADDIDPAYTAAFDRAMAAGVEALCYACRLSLTEIALDHPLVIAWPRAK
ncbi:MAG TPA: DNA/RNA nuclease SfsA [Magnetospirillaceae bacterium]|jgi:sugar fermentation stimulation protein A